MTRNTETSNDMAQVVPVPIMEEPKEDETKDDMEQSHPSSKKDDEDSNEDFSKEETKVENQSLPPAVTIAVGRPESRKRGIIHYSGYIPALLGAAARGSVTYSQLLLTCDALGILVGDPQRLKSGYLAFLLPLFPATGAVVVGTNNYFKHRDWHNASSFRQLSRGMGKYPWQTGILLLSALAEAAVVFSNQGYLINHYGDELTTYPSYFGMSIALSVFSSLQFLLREGREVLLTEPENSSLLARTITFIYAGTMGVLGAAEMYQVMRWALDQNESHPSANHFAWVPTFFFGMLYFAMHYTVYGPQIAKGIQRLEHQWGSFKLKKVLQSFKTVFTLPSCPQSFGDILSGLEKIGRGIKRIPPVVYYLLVLGSAGVVPVLSMVTAFGAMHEWLYISTRHRSPPTPASDKGTPLRKSMPLAAYAPISVAFAILSLPIALKTMIVESHEFLANLKFIEGEDKTDTVRSFSSNRGTGAYKQFLKDGLHLATVGVLLIALEKGLNPRSPGSWHENLFISSLTSFISTGITGFRLSRGPYLTPSSRRRSSEGSDTGSEVSTVSTRSEAKVQFDSKCHFYSSLFLLGVATLGLGWAALSGMQSIPGDVEVMHTNALFATASLIALPSIYIVRNGLSMPFKFKKRGKNPFGQTSGAEEASAGLIGSDKEDNDYQTFGNS